MDGDFADQPGDACTAHQLQFDVSDVPDICPLDRVRLRGSRGGAGPKRFQSDGEGTASLTTEYELKERGMA